MTIVITPLAIISDAQTSNGLTSNGWLNSVACLMIMVGIVYLLFGIRIFKALVMLNAAVVGGILAVEIVGVRGEAAIACAMVGSVFAAAIAWPTMKYAVALMGGIFGVLMGASIWHTIDLDPHLVWAGALVGLIGFGLLSFILFRGSVMMYTSLQGSFMLVFGILGLVYKYGEIAPQVTYHLRLEPFLLPASIFIPAVIGLIFQQHHHAAHAAGGGGGGGGKK
jgi:hypothetical protein